MSHREPLPFLTAQPSKPMPRALAAVLPVIDAPPGSSPWTPTPPPVADVPSPPVIESPGFAGAHSDAERRGESIDLEAERAAARAAGRADAERETAELRARLATLIAELERAHARLDISGLGALVADAATTVVGAWAGHGDRTELFAPVIRAWLAEHDGPAAVRVHPADVEAVKQVLGDAPLAVGADPGLAPGDIHIAGGALELAHTWHARLGQLRDAIIRAVEHAR